MSTESEIAAIERLIAKHGMKSVRIQHDDDVVREYYRAPDGSVRHDIIDRQGRPIVNGNHDKPVIPLPPRRST